MDTDKDNVSSGEQSMNFIREQVDIVRQLVNTVEQLVKAQPARNAVVDQMQTFKLLLDTSTATMTVAKEQCNSAKKLMKAAKQEKQNSEQLVNASESQLTIAKTLDNFAQAEMAKALEQINTAKLPTNSVNNIVNSAKVEMGTAEEFVNIEKNTNKDNLEPAVDPPKEQIYYETDPTVEVDPTEKCIDSDKQELKEVDSCKEQIYSESGQAAEMNPAKGSVNLGKREHTEIDSPKKQMYLKRRMADLTEECPVSDKQEVTEMDPPKNQIFSETCPAFEIFTTEECTDSGKHEVAEMVLCKEQISVYSKTDIPVEMGPAEECAELGKHELPMKPQMNICKLQQNSAVVTNTKVQTPIWNPCSIFVDKNAPNEAMDNEPCTSKQSVDVSEDDDVANKSISTGCQETGREPESWRGQEAVPDIHSTLKEHQSASDNNSCTSKIVVPYAHDRAQVWDPEVVTKLWTEHHIVGQLVGALPRKPHQNGVMGLPLSLMKEEVRLISEQNIGIPVIYKDMEQEANEKIRSEFQEQRRKCFEEQVEEARAQRKREIEMMADRILAGKRKKFEERKRKREGEVSNDLAEKSSGRKKHVVNRKLQKEVRSQEDEEAFTLTRENVIEEEVAKIRSLPEDMQVVEVFTQHPLINHFSAEPYIPSSTDSRRDCTKFAVFHDLWQRGYYVTQGLKFGGDFLAYPGDPHLYHACFIVRCVEDPSNVNHRDLVAATRLAATTKKTFVLAALKQESANAEVSYRSYQWAEED